MQITNNFPEPLVSVIIVSWNARGYLEQCLASLTEETCRYPMEIIVVDNASSDGSPECVERRFPRVRLIRSGGNLGFAKGNNLGIAHSSGRYLCLINSDVTVLKDCVTRLVDYCEAHPTVGMVGPRVIGGDGLLQRSCRGFPGLWNMFCRTLALDTYFPSVKAFCGYGLSHWPHDTQTQVDILSGCFWLVRKQALTEVGLLDEAFFMYGEDIDWCRRFWSAGWRLVFVPTAQAIHYGGASSANAPVRFAVEMQRAFLQYFLKHAGKFKTNIHFALAFVYHLGRAITNRIAWILFPSRRPELLQKFHISRACTLWLIKTALTGRLLDNAFASNETSFKSTEASTASDAASSRAA